MDMPMPSPNRTRPAFVVKWGSMILSTIDGSMPGPLSHTVTTTPSGVGRTVMRMRASTSPRVGSSGTPPALSAAATRSAFSSSMASAAFTIRFVHTCCSFAGCASTSGTSS